VREVIELGNEEHRLLMAMRYLNASEAIYKGLEQQVQFNSLHFLISLRSFIEYTRRGIWFLVWATDEKLRQAEKLTFRDSGSPTLENMDAMINEALGLGKKSHLTRNIEGINEPYIRLLHALTHGNPIAVRMTPAQLLSAFDMRGLLLRAHQDLNIFRVLLYRRMLGEKIMQIWALLGPIHHLRDALEANVMIAALTLKRSGKMPQAVGFQP
jgi:hypothetical protein